MKSPLVPAVFFIGRSLYCALKNKAITCLMLSILSSAYVAADSAVPDDQYPSNPSTDKNVIYWAKPELEPLFFAPRYKDKQTGFGDLILAELERQLPQYQHRELRANYARLISEIRNGNQVCAILHRSPWREGFTVFSDILALPPSYKLYTLASKEQNFNQLPGWEEGAVDLADVLQSRSDLLVAHTTGHSYGKALDAVMDRYQGKLNLVRGYAGQKSLVKMLLAGRVDVILEFPWVVNFHLRSLNIDAATVKSVTLNEGPDYAPSYVGCPNNDWGKKLVHDLNQISPSIFELMKSYIEAWLEPEEIIAYRKAYAEYKPADRNASGQDADPLPVTE